MNERGNSRTSNGTILLPAPGMASVRIRHLRARDERAGRADVHDLGALAREHARQEEFGQHRERHHVEVRFFDFERVDRAHAVRVEGRKQARRRIVGAEIECDGKRAHSVRRPQRGGERVEFRGGGRPRTPSGNAAEPRVVYAGVSARRRLVVSAIAGGTAGALLMDVTQYVWARVFERDRPNGDQDEETEAITAVVAWLTRAAPAALSDADAALLGRAIHYLFGIAFAGAYFLGVRSGRPAAVRGAVFGTLLWLISDRILIPAFKLGRPWSRYSPAERANALVSHLVYALTVEYTRLGE